MQSKSGGPDKPALYKALGVLLCVLASFFIAPSWYEIQQARQASEWIAKSARITRAEVGRYGGGRAHDIPRHAIDMQGIFLDSGQAFKVERIAFAQFSELDRIRAIIAEYTAGSEVVVYVAPDNPDRVVLQKDVDILPMIALICLGGVLAILGGIMFLKGKKSGEQPQSP